MKRLWTTKRKERSYVYVLQTSKKFKKRNRINSFRNGNKSVPRKIMWDEPYDTEKTRLVNENN